MFNITDGRDRYFGVDFLFLFVAITDVSHIYASLPDTWNFKPRSNFHERCENVHVTDGCFGK